MCQRIRIASNFHCLLIFPSCSVRYAHETHEAIRLYSQIIQDGAVNIGFKDYADVLYDVSDLYERKGSNRLFKISCYY